MKRILAVLTLGGLIVACSDFISRDVVQTSNGAGGNTSVTLPEKATIDPKACAYGEIASGDIRHKFIWDLSTQTICPHVREFRYNMTMLRLAVDRACGENELTGPQDDIEYLLKRALTSYQFLAGLAYGPLKEQMLDMEIYSYPEYNRFALNAEYIKAHETGDAYSMNLTPSRKGLAAIEQLVFNREALIPAGRTGKVTDLEAAFNALPLNSRKAARCRVLNVFLQDAARYTEIAYKAWSASEGRYPSVLLARISAGEAKNILNEISDSMFYLEIVKDFKIGAPLAMSARCTKPKCPEQIENAASDNALASLRANLEAFKIAFSGRGPGSAGFAHLLQGVSRDDLADLFRAKIAAVDATLVEAEAEGSFATQLAAVDKLQCVDSSSPFAICRLYFQVKEVMALYNSEFMGALDLTPPKKESDGDS